MGTVGGFAEYACAVEDNLALKPVNLSFQAAATIPTAALTALQGLRDKGQIQAGQRVVINGASGGVGTFATLIAKCFGSGVTAVCSTRNLGLARQIGADDVIDYTKEDFTRSGRRYDLIIAASGYHSILDYRRALRSGGMYVALGGSLAQILQAMLLGPWLSKIGSKKMGFMGLTKNDQKDLIFVKELIETGKVVPVIDNATL